MATTEIIIQIMVYKDLKQIIFHMKFSFRGHRTNPITWYVYKESRTFWPRTFWPRTFWPG